MLNVMSEEAKKPVGRPFGWRKPNAKIQKSKRYLPEQWEAVELMITAWAEHGSKILKYMRGLK